MRDDGQVAELLFDCLATCFCYSGWLLYAGCMQQQKDAGVRVLQQAGSGVGSQCAVAVE
jgi:hypothetical protein